MKLLLTNFHPDDGGGHTSYIIALARGLAPRHEVHVAAPPDSRLLREARTLPGVRAHAQPFPNGLDELPARWRARRLLEARLREHDFDVVHVNGSADHRLVLSAQRAAPRRPRLVLTKHNSKSMSSIGHFLRARRTDQVIAVCQYTRRQLETTAYRRCRIAVVPNGVDTAHFAPWPHDAARTERQRWVEDESVLLLGSNAGTAAYKGWFDLVEALAGMEPAARARVHLLIAGKMPDAQTLHRIEVLGVRGQVHFAGLLDDVRPVVAAFDAGFVLSHGVETISFACREMMSMGKPVLVSDYAGLPENVVDGADGWIVPTRDVAAIREAVRRLLATRDRLPAMAPREHALREFGIEEFVTRTEGIYLDLLR